ncbi:hypothetical protein QM012_007672 [Aureobasidium pullulans]|uniref:Rrn9 domain-containing protein n=1 Tax=Aureobasidium pullulans TaxID=5580 RepID=A0ABR0TKB7_AURPU
MSERFVRQAQEDEYLAARYYQLEAMLPSAPGALHTDSAYYKFRGMQWWAFDDQDTEEPWSGGESHSAMRDNWSKRPTMRTEDEIAERKAADNARERVRQRIQQSACVENDLYLCASTAPQETHLGTWVNCLLAVPPHDCDNRSNINTDSSSTVVKHVKQRLQARSRD